MYVLDGHLEHHRLAQEEITVKPLCHPVLNESELQAIASRSTGETVGDTAEFQAIYLLH